MSVAPTRARRRGRTWIQRLILLANMFLIAASLAAAALLQYAYDRASDIQRVELGRSLTPVPDAAAAGERVLNILLVGSDSSAGLDPSDPVQVGRQGERFGDVIIVAHIDERSGQIALLSFPRDLWLPLAGVNRSDRINRAFEVGGPAMLIDTIEQNFDLPIHHYINVDFAGFQGLVEAVGSVEVHFDTPARDWNVNAKPEPRSQTGFIVTEAGCHALDPPTALAYVRSRYYQTQAPDGTWVTDPTSDFGRITRQQDFLKRLMYRAIDLGARNPFVLADMVDTGLENVAIDESLTPQLLVDLGNAYRSFDPETLQTYSFPVVDAEIDGNKVLEPVLGEAEPLLAFLRGAPNDDPATIDLSVVTPADAPGAAATSTAIAAGLSTAGFDVQHIDHGGAPGGIVINHGPNGAAAAQVVADALGAILADFEGGEKVSMSDVSIAPVEDLAGRSVRIVIGLTDGNGGSPVRSGTAPVVGNSPQGGSAESADRTSSMEATTAPAVESGPPPLPIDKVVGADDRMGNGSTSPTLSAGNRDEDDSGSQPVNSNETACRST